MNWLLCLLPVIAHAQIAINIQASKDTPASFLHATGVYHSIITDKEQKIFHLNNETLKKAIFNLTGKVPTNVYLHGPTPWSDLYKTYSWEPVKTIIKPQSIKVINIETTEVVLDSENITNNGTADKKEKVSLIVDIVKNVTASWNQTDKFTAKIDYHISAIGMTGPDFHINSTYGQNFTEKNNDIVESPTVKLTLKPKSVATVEFKATNVTVTIEVEYLVTLDGYVATNNEVKLNGHHFWAYDVKNVLKAAGLPVFRKEKQIIRVQFCTDSKIVVGDH